MATRVKPASAPGRISGRDDIWKDISDWAKPSGRNNGDDQTLVIGSQIKDNITEQRMLESRLFDLSKERYKFIVQVAWQRKAFIDRQKQKTSVMKKLLSGIDTTEIQQSNTKTVNPGTKLKDRMKQYKELVEKTYPPKTPKSERNINTELFEKKPIFVERIYKTEPVFSGRNSGKSTKPISRYVGLQSPDRKRGFFPAIETQAREGTAQGRQSVPVNFMRREKVWTATDAKEALDRCKSTPTIRPRYLTYRSVYDRRFTKLQNCLTRPYNPDAHENNDLTNLMGQLNRTNYCSSPRDPTSDITKGTMVGLQ